MEERAFSRKCGKCRQRAVEIANVAYEVQIDHDGRKYNIRIPSLSVPRCANCGSISIDDAADKQISDAFRKEAGLLTPEEIKAGRERLGLNQQEFADWFGVAVSTLSRWETGAQVQQRVMNDFLEAFFRLPVFREFLRRRRGWGRAAEQTTKLAAQSSLVTEKATATSTSSLGDLPYVDVSSPFSFTSDNTAAFQFPAPAPATVGS